jgi:hypothetical protein
MASPNTNFDQVSAVTQKYYVPKLYDNIFDSNPLLQRLKKKAYEKISGGTQIVVPLNYATNTSGGWYSGAETLDTSDSETITAATFEWKQLYENITIQRMDELKNSGTAKMVNFVKSKMQIAEKSMIDKMSTGLYSSGTNAKSILGLRVFISASNTVGGISQSSNSWWQAQVDSTTTTMSIAALQAIDTDCTVNNDAPTVIVGTRTLYNSYYALLQPQQRFQDEETAKGGFKSLMFNGKPFLADSYAPASHVLFINESAVGFKVHEDEDMRFEPFQKPVNQNVKTGKIYWAGAFTVNNCRLLGGLTALTA